MTSNNEIHKGLLEIVKLLQDSNSPEASDMGIIVSTIGLALSTDNMHLLSHKCSDLSNVFMDELLSDSKIINNK